MYYCQVIGLHKNHHYSFNDLDSNLKENSNGWQLFQNYSYSFFYFEYGLARVQYIKCHLNLVRVNFLHWEKVGYLYCCVMQFETILNSFLAIFISFKKYQNLFKLDMDCLLNQFASSSFGYSKNFLFFILILKQPIPIQ